MNEEEAREKLREMIKSRKVDENKFMSVFDGYLKTHAKYGIDFVIEMTKAEILLEPMPRTGNETEDEL
jgi:hypothetical protein